MFSSLFFGCQLLKRLANLKNFLNFQPKTTSLHMENRPILKNYKTTSFLKNDWELKFQPMSDCHNKKIKKHSSYQEKTNFYKNNKGNAIYKT